MDPHEFEASLVYVSSSRSARALQWDHVSRKQNNKTNKKIYSQVAGEMVQRGKALAMLADAQTPHKSHLYSGHAPRGKGRARGPPISHLHRRGDPISNKEGRWGNNTWRLFSAEVLWHTDTHIKTKIPLKIHFLNSTYREFIDHMLCSSSSLAHEDDWILATQEATWLRKGNNHRKGSDFNPGLVLHCQPLQMTLGLTFKEDETNATWRLLCEFKYKRKNRKQGSRKN